MFVPVEANIILFMMQAAVPTVPLGSTPPQPAPARPGGAGAFRRPGQVFAVRGTPTEESQLSSSASRGSLNIFESGSWRSGLYQHSHRASIASSGTSKDVLKSPLQRDHSIKKSDGFVKVEGFSEPSEGEQNLEKSSSSPKFSTSPGLPRVPSLLTRQLSHENIAIVRGGSFSPKSPKYGCGIDDSTESLSSTVEAKPLNPRYSAIQVPRKASKRSSPEEILKVCQDRYAVFRESLAIKAFHIAYQAHGGSSGAINEVSSVNIGQDPFPRNVHSASILAELGADEVAVAGALLHDVLDKTMLVENQLRQMLGNEEVIELVKRVSHLGYVAQKYRSSINGGAAASGSDGAAGNSPYQVNATLNQMLNLMVSNGSPRSLLIRIAVALQDSRWLDSRGGMASTPPAAAAAREARRLRFAAEALDIWAPLANRLGVWSLKAELEDRAFRALHPAEYHELRERLEAAQEPTQLIGLMNCLRAKMQESDISYLDLSGRPKHLWGVWQKMRNKGYVATDRVHDVRGLRVIVKSREDCYRVLRAVETAFSVVAAPKNYIKSPKANGYQSLHVIADPGDGHLVEIQIRTDKMHYMAEYGAAAAHWKYKEGRTSQSDGSRNSEHGASWAKYEVSQTFANDKKVRPSGSPSEDHSLTSILAAMEDALVSDAKESTVGQTTPNYNAEQESNSDQSKIDLNSVDVTSGKGKSFEEYIASSGQHPVPPGMLSSALVAVVVNGNFSVIELDSGATLQDVIGQLGGSKNRQPLAIVNRQEETDFNAILCSGDMVELYPAELSPAADKLNSRCDINSRNRKIRGNMVPIGSLSKKFAESTDFGLGRQ